MGPQVGLECRGSSVRFSTKQTQISAPTPDCLHFLVQFIALIEIDLSPKSVWPMQCIRIRPRPEHAVQFLFLSGTADLVILDLKVDLLIVCLQVVRQAVRQVRCAARQIVQLQFSFASHQLFLGRLNQADRFAAHRNRAEKVV